MRDLRRRWLQVATIALIIAIGTGLYSGLGSTARWRYESNDASFELLAMYDLRVKAAAGADAAAGEMLAALGWLPDPGVVETAEERLVLPTQVDASTDDRTILVPGRIVGVDTSDAGPHVNGVYVEEGDGRTLTETDAGQPIAVLERNFTEFHHLAPSGIVRIAGDHQLRYVGTGIGPEYLLVTTEEGGFFAQANFAALFVPLETAQRVTGRPGRVNDLVLRLRDGADPVATGAAIADAFADSGLGITVMQRDDEDAYRLLYDDIEGDREFWNIFAGLILVGAAFGAFNLASRMIEAQRREIGIGMALGSTTPQLAARPLLAGAQIAVAGVIAGVAMGYLAILALRPVFTSVLPLPVWHTPLDWGAFAQGAALGFFIPFLATAWPVWRAVRVMPIDAMTTSHRAARGGLAPLLRRLRWPVSALRRMPLGNVLRTPRRTVLTALGIGAAIATLVAILGMLDSFYNTMDRNEDFLLGDRPERVIVTLDRYVSEDGDEVAAIAETASVGDVDPVLRVGARLDPDGDGPVDAVLEVLDMDSENWAPAIAAGRRPAGSDGVVIAAKAADDLGIRPGDRITVEHPRAGPDGISLARTTTTVAGIHPGPIRFNAYLDRSQLPLLGAVGVVNELSVLPAEGFRADDVERDLFGLDAVASVQPVSASTTVLKDALDEFTGIFRVLEAFILTLALLIAYNATSINADERAKERATMFAFGFPLRRLLAAETVEGLMIGALGTVVGVALGTAVLHWITTYTVASTMPDVGFDVVLTGRTIATAAVLGIVAVAVAPLLTVRRLRRMDIPGTLRVVE
jgi:putative ABC transport system permease protein